MTDTTPTRPLVGAIRWDAWHGDLGVPGRAVQQSLGPSRYQWRLPFFAVTEGETAIIDGTAPGVMEQEIAYASAAGIDYWAFVTYDEDDPMSIGLAQYLASPRREEINFCLVTETSRWAAPDFIERVTRLMCEPGYQTVLDGRPLLYLGFVEREKVDRHWGGPAGFRAVLDDWRATLSARGFGDPYLVIMSFEAEHGKQWADLLGADAVSSYATCYAPEADLPYARLAEADVDFWERCAATGAAVVPIVTAGWDRRPRIEYPMPWETWQQPGVGMDQYVHAATPAELADHLKESLDWIARHPTFAQTSLIYAWNENDEGGWIVPTVHDGPARLRAIGAMLRSYLGR